ncbi:hypothetical protein [Kiritimatiella glycovorans]|nr:hypothetical protein [Kiritimatiella glycovorans]
MADSGNSLRSAAGDYLGDFRLAPVWYNFIRGGPMPNMDDYDGYGFL